MTSQQYNKILTTINSVTSNYSFTPDLDNVIVIDTSNNRIGINTANPECSIDVSNGKIKTENLTILGDASINNIKNLYINNDRAIDNGMYLNNNKILYYYNNLFKLDSSNIRILGNVIFENAPTFSSGDVTTTTSADTGGGFIYNTSIGINSNGGIDPSGGYFTFLNLINNTQSIDTGTGALVVNGGAGIARNLNVGGDASINNILEVSNNLLVKGNSKLENNLDVGGDASINNILEVSNNLLVKGNSKLENNLDVGTVTVTGNTTINGTLNMGANIFIPELQDINSNRSKIHFSDGLFLHGSSAFSGPPVISLRDGRAGNIYFSGYAAPTGQTVGRLYPQVSNGPSDDRLKHNEVIIDNGLSIIRQLVPQKYQKTNEMKDANFIGELEEGTWRWEAGVIAQDVEKIQGLEYLVGEGGFPLQEDVDNGMIYKEYPKTIVYNDLFIYNIAATKELDVIVQMQQIEINNLKTENTLLKSKLNEILTEMGKTTID